jgi:hypothetical protein
MVDVTVRQQYRHRPQPVPGGDVRYSPFGVLARVDDHALRAGLGRHQITVGGPRAGREPRNEHGNPPNCAKGGFQATDPASHATNR